MGQLLDFAFKHGGLHQDVSLLEGYPYDHHRLSSALVTEKWRLDVQITTACENTYPGTLYFTTIGQHTCNAVRPGQAIIG